MRRGRKRRGRSLAAAGERITLAIVVTLIGHTPLRAQATGIGLEAQLYPAGVIVTGLVSRELGTHDRVTAHAGLNVTRRRDFGRHDDERGSGPGLGVAWSHAWTMAEQGWRLGFRTDAWFLTIEWSDEDPPRSGRTEIVVLQPTVQLAYRFLAARERLSIEPTVSLGAEINVSTDGEEVGEGAILLLGIAASWHL